LKDYGDIDSKFRYVILAAMRAKQLLGGAKPRIKSRSKNLIRIAQEEVKQGLVDFELVKTAKEEVEDATDSDKEMFIGEEIVPDAEEKPKEKSSKDEEPEKGKED
jgi:DNA-directed RNA polymerase subunit omega